MLIKYSSATLSGRISLKSVTTLGIEKQDQRQSSALNISTSIFFSLLFFSTVPFTAFNWDLKGRKYIIIYGNEFQSLASFPLFRCNSSKSYFARLWRTGKGLLKLLCQEETATTKRNFFFCRFCNVWWDSQWLA